MTDPYDEFREPTPHPDSGIYVIFGWAVFAALVLLGIGVLCTLVVLDRL